MERIKNINEDKFQGLNKIYHAKFSGPNVPKKYIMGFYGTLVQEIKNLTEVKEVIHFPTKKATTKSKAPASKTKKVEAKVAKKPVKKKVSAAKKK